MTQTLDGILKTKLLTNSGIPASRAFTQTIADLLPNNATIIDAIHIAQSLYLQATGCASVLPKYAINSDKLPSEIRGFNDPYARQSVSDFSYILRDIIRENVDATAQYATFRPTAALHEAFVLYLPVPQPDKKVRLVAA